MVTSGTSTYIGTVTSGGTVQISEYDHSTGATATESIGSMTADRHNSAAVLVGASGHIWAFYTEHNTEAKIYYRRTTDPADITAWDVEQELTFGANTTYPQVYQDSNGRIVVFVRQNTGTNARWAVRYTDDDGDNWSAAREWVDGGAWTYLSSVQRSDPDTVGFACFFHPSNASAHDVYYFEADLTSGSITVPGSATELANLYSGDLFDPAADGAILTLDWTSGDEVVRLGQAVSREREIVWTSWDPAQPSSATARYVKIAGDGAVGTLRTVATIGKPIVEDGADTMFTGPPAITPGGGTVYMGRYVAGRWGLWRMATTDAGASWSEVCVYSAPNPATPYLVRPRSDDSLVMAAESAKWSGDFTDWEAATILTEP